MTESSLPKWSAETVPVIARVEQLCELAHSIGGTNSADAVTSIRERLHEPLRVAVAGRVKAGKSTLLNALIGERLAPTDAGECTRIVTWYRRGISYGVDATLRTGATKSLRFERTERVLDIDLGDLHHEQIHHLDVTWPSSRLARMTLVDTPGLESLDEDRSLRTRALFGVQSESPSEVDAVVYLMRHLHPTDRTFLDSFLDRSFSRPSPVNAIAVLSRADEIGAGRLDALDSASTIADRYAADERVRALCSTVVPVAGLIAETGFTLREDEVRALRQLVTRGADEVDLLVVSVDRFCTPGVGPVTVGARRDLLDRLGLFGVRFCLQELRDHRDLTATDLAQRLRDASGIATLRRVLDEQLAPLSDVLKARSAIVALRGLVDEIGRSDPEAARKLATAIERFESSSHELAELRLLHLVFTGQINLTVEERVELERLVRAEERAERLGLPNDADFAAQELVALDRLESWRSRAGHPLTSRSLADACEIIAESYERLYAELLAR